MKGENFDSETVRSFGDEWSRHHQADLDFAELMRLFDAYFHLVPFDRESPIGKAFDMGVGSGRWATLVAPKVDELHVIDASEQALAVARRNLARFDNVVFHHATTDQVDLVPESFDFGYSLGVLHHIPNTKAALQDCVRLLRPGGRLLVYLYYRFDNRPAWYRTLWWLSDLVRRMVYRLPRSLKSIVSDIFALSIYWPLSRAALLFERLGFNVSSFPLSSYRHCSFTTLRTDSRDRFGTPLEQRFTRAEIETMMREAGLAEIRFSDRVPYWCATGIKASGAT